MQRPTLDVYALAVNGEISDQFLFTLDEKTIKAHLNINFQEVNIYRILPDKVEETARTLKCSRFPQFVLKANNKTFNCEGFEGTNEFYAWIRSNVRK